MRCYAPCDTCKCNLLKLLTLVEVEITLKSEGNERSEASPIWGFGP